METIYKRKSLTKSHIQSVFVYRDVLQAKSQEKGRGYSGEWVWRAFSMIWGRSLLFGPAYQRLGRNVQFNHLLNPQYGRSGCDYGDFGPRG